MNNNSKNHVVMLPRELLVPHPDNPRKDLGDLEELRASIREHGIMQNLTVVSDSEDEDNYRILIGHRRFAASEGILDKLPCVVVKGLSHSEQVGIMLCENMQRSDLTVFEQAHGFQMMLDLGDTVEAIADKTGFSETTVKHRLEISKLDKNSLDKVQEYFQPTIADYIELEKVKDIEERNRILEIVESSRELKDEVKGYVEEQLREENSKKYLALFKSLGWNETKEYLYTWGDSAKYKEINGLTKIDLSEPYNDENIKAAALRITEPIYYQITSYFVNFAIKNPKKKEEKVKTKEERMEEARKKREVALDGARFELCDLYYDFIVNIPDKRLKEVTDKSYKEMLTNLIDALISIHGTMRDFSNNYGIRTKADIKNLQKDFPKYGTLQKLMLNVWAELTAQYSNKLVLWNFTKNNPVLEAHQTLYSILHFFGFRLNDEQKAIIEGTSELFTAHI